VANSMYVPMTAAVAAERQLDVLANDLANVDTPGYKKVRTAFKSHLVARYGDGPAVKALVALDETRVDASPGAVEATGNPLDVALDPDHYLLVETPAGPALSRNGRLSIRADGTLTDSAGNPLRGAPMGQPFVPIRVAPDAGDLHIGDDGRIFQDGTEVASLAIVTARSLRPLGDGTYTATDAASATGSVLRSGFLEGSNVNPVRGMVRLVEATRSFELQQRVLRQFREIDAATQRIDG